MMAAGRTAGGAGCWPDGRPASAPAPAPTGAADADDAPGAGGGEAGKRTPAPKRRLLSTLAGRTTAR